MPTSASRVTRRRVAATITAASALSAALLGGLPTTGASAADEPRSTPVPMATPDGSLASYLLNARTANRLTVVFDGSSSDGTDIYVAGAKAADGAEHPELRAEISRMQDLGYLAG